jgi:hypothetical protein
MTNFTSPNASPAVDAVNTGGGPGVHAKAVRGSALIASVTGSGGAGSTSVWGETPAGRSIVGVVRGEGTGLWGDVRNGRAIVGVARDSGANGVWGETTNGSGVVGKDNGGGDGVVGEGRRGVVGRSPSYQGVYGWSDGNAGVVGESVQQYGLYGLSRHANGAGLFAYNENPAGCAARLQGRVEVLGGDLVLRGGDVTLDNADCAEDFDVLDGELCEPGTVMVLTGQGCLRASAAPYDPLVAGVISGAGGYRPGLILDRRAPAAHRRPLALLGKVFCKVDADHQPIVLGDLLTTSDRPGHAMKAADRERAFGAVLGKALRPLSSGQGLIPVLVALQ